MRLLLGDCLEVLEQLEDASIDAVVTDPPYGIGFMGHEWDQPDHPALRGEGRWHGGGPSIGSSAAMLAGRYDLSSTASRRFQAWCEAWAAEAFRVLKPGGHLLAFGGTRTYHRLAAGVEDAGFEIRDQLAWMFGSGFPKSLDVSKAIDRAAGVEREVVGRVHRDAHLQNRRADPVSESGFLGPTGHFNDVTAPATEDAARWQGWGTALKPAYEPIVVARKPLSGTVAGNVLEHGVGAINVDACRIATSDPLSGSGGPLLRFGGENARPHNLADEYEPRGTNRSALGRWPANVILGHSPDCVLVGTREVASDGHFPSARPGGVEIGTVGHAGQGDLEERYTRGEVGEDWECVGDCPVRLLDEQSGERPAGAAGTRRGENAIYGKLAADDGPWGSFGDTGGASRFFYCAKTSRAERNAGLDEERNGHPTVKPVELMRWLVRLVAPPSSTVLDPFLGSGTTGIACALEGLDFVGVERDPEYLRIAEARIGFWVEHGEATLQVVSAREQSDRTRREVADAGQLDLLGETA